MQRISSNIWKRKSTISDRRRTIDVQESMRRLEGHVRTLTVTIGERSICFPDNLDRTADYIRQVYREIGLPVSFEPYRYHEFTVQNVIAELSAGAETSGKYVVGAHYDTVAGTVGADDNASAIAVQLETARHLKRLQESGERPGPAIQFASFALEEPPCYGTGHMGSRVLARKTKERKEKIDGMICLEMVGYTCREPGCQNYPFPLMFMGYPGTGDFIGIVGDTRSRPLTRALYRSFRKNPELPVVRLTIPLRGWLQPAVRLSDHASYWDEGFRAVMITDSAFYRNPHYHLPSDTMDKLDFSFMAALVESLVLFFNETD